MNTVETNVVNENVVEAEDIQEVVVCDYNKLGLMDGLKIVGRSIKRNGKKIAIGAGVVTAVGVGALIAHATKKGKDDSDNDVIDTVARDVNIYDQQPEVGSGYDNYYQAAEQLQQVNAELNSNDETVVNEEITD